MNKYTILIIILIFIVLASIFMQPSYRVIPSGPLKIPDSNAEPEDLIPRDNLPDDFNLTEVKIHIEQPEKDILNWKDRGIEKEARGIYSYNNDPMFTVSILRCKDAKCASDVVEFIQSWLPGNKYIIMNGHTAIEWVQEPFYGKSRYDYIWSNGNFVFYVESDPVPPDIGKLSLELAISTGY